MTMLQRAIGNMFGSGAATMRSAQWGDSSIPPNSALLSLSGTGQALTEKGALGVSTVLSCVKVKSQDLSILPMVAFEGLGNEARPMKQQPRIITEPFGPDLDPVEGMKQLYFSYELRGNAICEILEWDSQGNPTLLNPMHPDRVKVRRHRETGVVTYTIEGEDVERYRILHLKNLSPPGALTGIDPVTYQRVVWGMASDRNTYGAGFYRNAATPSGIISVPGMGNSAKARQIQEAWMGGHSGVANAHKPAVMFGGAKWQQLSVTPDNAQFLETGQFLREDICGWFGVPLQRIQSSPKTGAPTAAKGLDTMDQEYASHSLMPTCKVFESHWKRMIPGGERTKMRYDFAELLRANDVERAQVAQVHRLIGARSVNEVRAAEGWAPIPGDDGDNYGLPFNTNSASDNKAGGGAKDDSGTGREKESDLMGG